MQLRKRLLKWWFPCISLQPDESIALQAQVHVLKRENARLRQREKIMRRILLAYKEKEQHKQDEGNHK